MSILKALFKRDEVKEKKISENFISRGSTGTEIYSGRFFEEYLSDFLNMPQSMDIYDKMRRTDSQVQALRNVVRNPILGANWSVTPVDDTDEEKKIKRFIEFILFEDISYPSNGKSKTWPQFVSEALTMIDFGYSLFEVIHKVEMNHPVWGNYIGLKDIAYRSQKTIEEWNLSCNGGLESVRQCADGDLSVDVNIPGEDLLVMTINKEGDNYEGISLLRSIYGNWKRKCLYYKLQAIGMERGALGVPKGKMDATLAQSEAEFNKLKAMLERYTSNESGFILHPEGTEIDMFSLKYDSKSVDEAINNEDKRMAKAFNAGFLELGMSGGSGSYALGTDISDMQLNGIQYIANIIADEISRKVITPLVKANFGHREKYPKMTATRINDKAGKEKAEIIVMLKNAGVIRQSDLLEDMVNKEYDLPILTAEQKEQEELKIQSAPPVAPQLSEGESISFAETKAPKLIKNGSSKMEQLMQTELTKRSEEFLKKVDTLMRNEGSKQKIRKGVESMPIPGQNTYKKALKSSLTAIASEATRQVISEVGVSSKKLDEVDDALKDLPQATRDKVKAESSAIAETQDVDLKKSMFFILSQKIDTTDSTDSLIADMRKSAARYIASPAIVAGSTNAVSGTVNTARNAVFQKPEVLEEIESFVIVNPTPEAAICKELVGRVFSKDDYLNQDLPPYHHNCETTVRAQLKGQKSIKPVSPIGLALTGTPDQVERILKSKTFKEV
jgi:hypothetical protein